MLVAFAGLISGYDGSFEFKSGERYPENVPFVGMRVYLALFGVAMVPLGWLTASELHFSYKARHLVAWMVLFGVFSGSRVTTSLTYSPTDLAWVTISRFILLDSLLLCFTCTTVYFLTKFHNQQYRFATQTHISRLLLTLGLQIIFARLVVVACIDRSLPRRCDKARL